MKEIISIDKKYRIYPISKWITVKHTFHANKRNALYEYVTDEYGHRSGSKEYNPINGRFLDYFEFNRRKYAVEQFYLLNSMWLNSEPIQYKSKNEIRTINTVDMDGFILDPIYAEFDIDAEKVRLYKIRAIT